MSARLAACLSLALAACADPALSPSGGRDWSPPTLDILAPARGTILTTPGPVEVRGRVADQGLGVARVTVNGAPATVAADGSFRASVQPVPGITLLESAVVDGEGNGRSETRAVLGGDLAPVETMLRDAVVVRLDREALRVVGELARRTLAETDFNAMVVAENPLVNVAAPCFAARVEARRLGFGAVEVALVPVEGGLELSASIADIDAGFHVVYDAFCKHGEGDVTFSARSFRLDGALSLTLADGKVAADASRTTAAFEDFVWGGDVLPERVRDVLDGPLGAALAEIVADQVRERVPGLVVGRLDGRERAIQIGDQQLVMALRPAALLADARGLAFALDTSVYVAGAPGTVFPVSAALRPPLDDPQARALRLAISDDALNQLLASLWGAGLLEQQLELDATDRLKLLGLDFDHIAIIPRLPPVVEALPSGGGLRLTAGDVEAHLVKRVEGQPPRIIGRIVVSVRVTVAAKVVDDRLALTPVSPELHVDVLTVPGEKASVLHEESLRALGGFVTDHMMQLLGSIASGMPIPTLDDLSIVDAHATSRPNGGYLEIAGDVKLR